MEIQSGKRRGIEGILHLIVKLRQPECVLKKFADIYLTKVREIGFLGRSNSVHLKSKYNGSDGCSFISLTQ